MKSWHRIKPNLCILLRLLTKIFNKFEILILDTLRGARSQIWRRPLTVSAIITVSKDTRNPIAPPVELILAAKDLNTDEGNEQNKQKSLAQRSEIMEMRREGEGRGD